MFTIEQVHNAFSKVKSGEDFPLFIQDLKHIGVMHYDNFVADGRTVYYGLNDFNLQVDAKYAKIAISKSSSSDRLKQAIIIHQQGETDYPTFCVQAAAAGVEKWTTNVLAMTVTYFDIKGIEMLVEAIPRQ